MIILPLLSLSLGSLSVSEVQTLADFQTANEYRIMNRVNVVLRVKRSDILHFRRNRRAAPQCVILIDGSVGGASMSWMQSSAGEEKDAWRTPQCNSVCGAPLIRKPAAGSRRAGESTGWKVSVRPLSFQPVE